MSAAELHPVYHGGDQPFRITLEDADGDPCHQFTKDGPVEIWLTAGPAHANGQGETVDAGDSKFMVVPIKFPNYPIARQHSDALALVCRLLQNALNDAREHAADPIPTLNDGHLHVVRFARYTRRLPFAAMCEICMEQLVDDVTEWAHARGLIGDNSDTFSRTLRVLADDFDTVKAAIEKAFNQDGGTDG